MFIRKFALSMMILAGLGLIIAGCSSTDDGPTNPSQNDTLNLTGDEAEDFSTTALTMVNDIVNSIPEFAAGDFETWNAAKSQPDSIQWDAGQQAYVFSFNGPVFELEPPNYWYMSLGVWLQYRDAMGTPLQYPVGATEMELDYTTGMDMHMVDGESASDLEYEMATNLVVSYLGGGESYGVEGTGSTTYTMAQIAPQGSQSGQFSMDWTLDLTATPDGCPSGTARVNCQGFVLDATYDGQGGMSWTLVGDNYQASGSEYLACSQPVN